MQFSSPAPPMLTWCYMTEKWPEKKHFCPPQVILKVIPGHLIITEDVVALTKSRHCLILSSSYISYWFFFCLQTNWTLFKYVRGCKGMSFSIKYENISFLSLSSPPSAVWIQGEKHQEEKSQHRGVCRRRESRLEEKEKSESPFSFLFVLSFLSYIQYYIFWVASWKGTLPRRRNVWML